MATTVAPFAAAARFRARLAARAELPLVGVQVQLADPISSDAMGTVVDFIWYDQEHTPMSMEMLKWHMLAAHARGVPAIVRVSGPNNHAGRGAAPWGAPIKAALDGGADGIVVPMIRSAADVAAIVADCRYPTGGGRPPPDDGPSSNRRGFGPTTPMEYGRSELYSYLAAADRNVFTAVMIETVEALKDIDAICAVPGLDCVVLGLNDLSGSLGVPYEGGSPVVQAAVDRVIAAARSQGVYVMFSTRNAELASRLVSKGVDIVHFGSDVMAAVDHQRAAVASLKRAGSARL